MLKIPQSFAIISRFIHKQKPVHLKAWEKEAVKYGHIKYYPRFPDHKDPEFEPSKLFLVERIKPYKGQPYWHKTALENLNIHERGKQFTIVKNTPSECARLWSIKHLIKVTPIKLPKNFTEDDIKLGRTFLQENGKFQVIKQVDPVCIEESKHFEKHEKKMDKITVQRQLRLKWLNPIA